MNTNFWPVYFLDLDFLIYNLTLKSLKKIMLSYAGVMYGKDNISATLLYD